MRNLNRIMAVYDGILNGINSGKGCVYKINWEIDIEKIKNMILNMDTFINKLDNHNELYNYSFFKFLERIKMIYEFDKEFNILKLLHEFIGMEYLDKERSFPLLFLTEEKDIILYNSIDNREVPEFFLKFKEFLYPIIANDFKVSDDYEIDNLCYTIKKRLSEIEKFFLIENSVFIKNLMENFPDKISKESFKTYLEQRCACKIHTNYNVVLPIQPPKITQNWRNERLSMQYKLPIINSVSELSVQNFYYATYKLEQYAISGVVEAEKGDVVIDAGAFVGDTAMYFAQKVGMTGKVYAFEPVKSVANLLDKNIKTNKMNSVIEIVPYALSDINKTLYFTDNASNSTAIDLDNVENNLDVDLAKSVNKTDLMEVKAVSLDSFVQENNIRKVDFLKADLQGADVDFVKGALKTIARDAPKCGLTVYHKPEDFIAIPKLLMSVRDDYVFYFRCETEPVLFAKKKE